MTIFKFMIKQCVMLLLCSFLTTVANATVCFLPDADNCGTGGINNQCNGVNFFKDLNLCSLKVKEYTSRKGEDGLDREDDYISCVDSGDVDSGECHEIDCKYTESSCKASAEARTDSKYHYECYFDSSVGCWYLTRYECKTSSSPAENPSDFELDSPDPIKVCKSKTWDITYNKCTDKGLPYVEKGTKTTWHCKEKYSECRSCGSEYNLSAPIDEKSCTSCTPDRYETDYDDNWNRTGECNKVYKCVDPEPTPTPTPTPEPNSYDYIIFIDDQQTKNGDDVTISRYVYTNDPNATVNAESSAEVTAERCDWNCACGEENDSFSISNGSTSKYNTYEYEGSTSGECDYRRVSVSWEYTKVTANGTTEEYKRTQCPDGRYITDSKGTVYKIQCGEGHCRDLGLEEHECSTGYTQTGQIKFPNETCYICEKGVTFTFVNTCAPSANIVNRVAWLENGKLKYKTIDKDGKAEIPYSDEYVALSSTDIGLVYMIKAGNVCGVTTSEQGKSYHNCYVAGANKKFVGQFSGSVNSDNWLFSSLPINDSTLPYFSGEGLYLHLYSATPGTSYYINTYCFGTCGDNTYKQECYYGIAGTKSYNYNCSNCKPGVND